MDRSIPGSISKAAARDSSSARFAGFLPWACEITTVNFCRLIFLTFLHVPLEALLRLFPVFIQELEVFFNRQGVVRCRCHFEEPASPVVIHINGRWIIQQLAVELDYCSGDWSKQVGHGLGGLYMANFLQFLDRVAWAQVPVEEINI